MVKTFLCSLLFNKTLFWDVLIACVMMLTLFGSVLLGSRLDGAVLPRVTVNTTLPAGWDGTADATPSNSAALVTALSNVVQNAGIYIIELTAGTTYTGTFVVDNNAGTDWLVIRSSGWDSSPPVAEGVRALPADASNMATIEQTGVLPCLRMDFGSHHIRLIGVEFTVDVATTVFTLVGFGSGSAFPTVESEVANNVTYDRCYITSTSTTNRCRTGIQFNCDLFAFIDGYIDNIKDTADAQAIQVHIGTGLKFHNSFLEGTGENILFGGDDTSISDRMGEDATISKCHFFKRDVWNINHPSYGDILWGVKNLFELKMAKRVHIHSCVFENCWAGAQSGRAIVLTVRDQSGTNHWATVEDVVFENNKVFRVGRFIFALADDDANRSRQAKRVRVRNVLVHTQGGSLGGGAEDFGVKGQHLVVNTRPNGRPYLDWSFNHCTMLFQEGHLGGIAFSGENQNTAAGNVKGIKVLNSIWDDAEFAFKSAPDQTSNGRLVNWVSSGNGIIFNDLANGVANRRANFATHFPNDTKADTIEDAKFTDNANQDYTLQNDSPFKGAAAGGRDCGVDHAELNAAIAGVV